MYVLDAKKYTRKKDYKKAISSYKKASKIFEKLPRVSKELVSIYDNMALVYKKMGDRDRAEKYFEKAVRLGNRLPEREIGTWLAVIYNHYALFLAKERYDYRKSREYLRKSEALTLRHEKRLTVRSKVYNLLNISSVYETVGLFDEELAVLKKAERFVEHAGDPGLKILVYLYLSDAYRELDEVEKALESLEEVEKLSGNQKRDMKWVQMVMRKAAIYRKLSLYDLALAEYRKIKRINHSGMLYDFYNGRGICYSNLKRFDSALEDYRRALEIADRNRWLSAKASVYNNLGRLYRRKKDYQKALEYYGKSLKIHSKKSQEKKLATNYVNIASLYLEQGEYGKALEFMRRAYAIRKKIYGPKSYRIASMDGTMSRIYKGLDDWGKAYLYSRKAFENMTLFLQKTLPALSNREQTAFFRKTRKFAAHYLEAVYESRRGLRELFDSWLNYKGSVFDTENMIATIYASSNDPEIKRKIKELVREKRTLARLYQTLPKPGSREVWQRQIQKREQRAARLVKELSKRLYRLRSAQGVVRVNGKELSKHLKEDELYIDFARTEEYYYLFTLDRENRLDLIRLGKRESARIDELVSAFREDIDTILNESDLSEAKLEKLTKRSREHLSELFTLLMTPIEKRIRTKRSLLLSPAGFLRLLPFEALYDARKGSYFIEEKEIRYIPGGKELVRLHRYADIPEDSREIVLFDNPDFDTEAPSGAGEEKRRSDDTRLRVGIIKSLFKMQFAPLPGTKEEAWSIKEILAGKRFRIKEYSGTAASEENLIRTRRPQILHIATHGFFLDDSTIPNPMLKSGLALSGANTGAKRGTGAGIVTALKLSGMDLRGTDLVVLSACQTGVMDRNSTDSLSGLSKAFIQAGAGDIVMSLWSVDDQATKELMRDFYREMKRDPDYSRALKEAKLKMIGQGRHPFFWAPFVLNGL